MPQRDEPDTDLPLTAASTTPIELPLYPTVERTPDGRPVWETAAELDSLAIYTLLLGGPDAPGVDAVSHDVLGMLSEPLPPRSFDPLDWNWHGVVVINSDFTSGDGGWQRLTLAAP